MKQGWEEKKLGEVCVVERGSSPRPIQKYQTDNEDGVNWIKIGDTKGVDKYITKTKEKITKEGAEKSRYVKEGDFILSNSMSFGKPYIMKTDGYIHDGWFVFRLPDYIDKDYFYHLLTSPKVQEQIQSLGSGAIVKNISGDLVKKVNVSYPISIKEQQRIVSILDTAFEAIEKAKANAEQNLKNSKELFESYLQNIFSSKGSALSLSKGEGWEERSIQEITKVINGYAFASKDFNSTNTIKSIKITNVGVKEFVEETENYLPEKFRESLKDVQVREGNIVIALTRTIISSGLKVAIVPKSYDNALVNQRVAALVPNEKIINQRYLYYFLTTDGVAKYVLTHVNTLMQPNLSINDLKNLSVPYPSLNHQSEIVKKLDTLSAETKRLEAIYQQKLIDLEELKKSLLEKAFKGELKTDKIEVV